MKKIDRRIIIVVSLIFIVGLAFGLMKYLINLKEEPPRRPPGDNRRYVKTEKVEYKKLFSPVEASGRLNSVSEVDIVAEASGKIIPGKIVLKKGSAFKKGDLLFTVYKDEAVLSLQARKSQFQNSLANILPDIRMDFGDYEQQLMNFFTNIETDKLLPAFPDIKDDKFKIFLASRNILSDYYSIRRDELQLSRHSIFAPFEGTFTDVFLEAGAYTNTGGRVAHAIQTNLLELEVPVRKVDAAWINIGDKVTVIREHDPESWEGEVLRIGKFLDDDYQRQAIFISLRNSGDHQLLNGEYLTARFPEYPVDNVMEMPRSAVFNANEVFVVVDGRLESQEIEIIKTNAKTILFRGLEEGSTLVVQALINVQEGVMVTTERETIQGPAQGSQGQRPGQKPGSKSEKGEQSGAQVPGRNSK